MTTVLDRTESSTPTPASALEVELTALDRCDGPACGAQARAVATTGSGGVLLFCRHHAEALRPALKAAGVTLATHYEGLSSRLDASA
jgi:hypothetical protein